MMRIAADGRVDEDEYETYTAALEQLRQVVAAGMHIEYAKEEDP